MEEKIFRIGSKISLINILKIYHELNLGCPQNILRKFELSSFFFFFCNNLLKKIKMLIMFSIFSSIQVNNNNSTEKYKNFAET